MKAFVLDASIAISWCFEETQTPYAISVLELVSDGAQANVPLIWPLEVTNALVKALRRKHISRGELLEYAQRLAQLKIAVDHGAATLAFSDVLTLAERFQLTTYDAAYLELAKRRNLPLATADGNLLQAAAGFAAPVVQAWRVPKAKNAEAETREYADQLGLQRSQFQILAVMRTHGALTSHPP